MSPALNNNIAALLSILKPSIADNLTTKIKARRLKKRPRKEKKNSKILWVA